MIQVIQTTLGRLEIPATIFWMEIGGLGLTVQNPGRQVPLQNVQNPELHLSSRGGRGDHRQTNTSGIVQKGEEALI